MIHMQLIIILFPKLGRLMLQHIFLQVIVKILTWVSC